MAIRFPIGSSGLEPSAPADAGISGQGVADTPALPSAGPVAEKGFARTETDVERLELLARDLRKAPPSIGVGNARAVFVDFQRARTELVFDVVARQVRVRAEVEFVQTKRGCPIIDLQQPISGLEVDGRPLDATAFRETEVPGESFSLTRVDRDLSPGRHTVVLEYALPQGPFLQLDPDGARFFQVANDLLPGRFSEQFFPSNLEFDQYPHTLELKIVGGTRAHRVMANGEVAANADGSFTITYPPYFNTASFYLDLVDPAREFIVDTTIKGQRGDIPVALYGKEPGEVKAALAILQQCIPEYEAEFGAYPHAGFVGRIMGKGGGGMEYSGAAVMCGRESTVRHEVLHSWFARSVMPASGNAGWIDEAIATWLESGAKRSETATTPATGGTQLTRFTPYTRATPLEAYEFGDQLLRQLDFVFRDAGGIRAQLRALFAEFANQTITTGMFEDFLQRRTAVRLEPLFNHWVYGGHLVGPGGKVGELPTFHSRRKTAAQIARSCMPDHGFAIEPAVGSPVTGPGSFSATPSGIAAQAAATKPKG